MNNSIIEIDIPNFNKLSLKHIVLDYNGTLALDGKLLAGVKERLVKLAETTQIHVVTADTFGDATSQLKDITCKLHILEKNNEDLQKESYIKTLGSENVVAIGNGRKDRRMLKTAGLGIAVIGSEGCAIKSLQAADIVVTDINHGLDLLLNPLRCKATLRY
jgi:soluble P-type ATPase